MYELNNNQREAAEHLAGPMMVLAGPGSGKTAVITARAARLVTQDVGGVLVITYSKAAAGEMERRYKSLGNHSSGDITFGTFHSVFFRMLRRGRDYNLDGLMQEGEQREVIRGLLTQMQYEPDYDLMAKILLELSLMRNDFYQAEHYHCTVIASEDFREMYRGYEAYKTSRNKFDFDDMLCHTYNMLETDERQLAFWRQRFPSIMIDEFQDINRVQYETVKLLAAPSDNLFIVGDDDQSIYRFRGSRPEFLLNFPKDFPQTRQVTLETNYRSTDSIITYANNLITHNKMRYSKSIVGTGRVGRSPTLLTSEDQITEAALVGEHIRRLLKRGADLDSIAIAFRLNIQSQAIMDAFTNMGIPFKCRDEMPTIYEHWVAEDFFAYLRLARRMGLRQKTGFDPDAERIINKPWRYISRSFIIESKRADANIFTAYKRNPRLHIASKNTIEELYNHLLTLSKLNTSDAISYIRRNMGYNGHIIDTCEYRKINSDGLFELADEVQTAAKSFPDPMGFADHGAQMIKAAKERGGEGACCTLTTLHSAKGLEFDIVFLVGLTEEILPHILSKTPAEIEEERRLFYVGVTRAKNVLYLSTTKSRYGKDMKPSRFLENRSIGKG